MTRHVLSVLVTNRPGVLTRVSGLFARRGYNIESLTVSPTDDPSESRMTIGVSVVSAQALEQIVKQLNKLIEVHKIVELDPGAVTREPSSSRCAPTSRIVPRSSTPSNCSGARPSTSHWSR